MITHLLVGVGDADVASEPHLALVDLLAGLRAHGVWSQVAVFGGGPATTQLTAVSDVVDMSDWREGDPGHRVEAAARRVRGTWGDRAREAAAPAARRGVVPPTCVLVHGTRGAPVLRYAPDVPVAVITYRDDHSIAGVDRPERLELVRRARHWAVPHGMEVDDLLVAGVDADRIERLDDVRSLIPQVAPRTSSHLARRVLGLPTDRLVVAIPAVDGWSDLPDPTVRVAWELQRLGSAATILWYGVPSDADGRWPLESDVHRARLTSMRMVTDHLGWAEVVELSDAVLLPSGASDLPGDFGAVAARQARPILCWADHPRAAEVAASTGAVIDRGDVVAMARAVHDALADDEALRRARATAWAHATADLQRLLPLGIEVP